MESNSKSKPSSGRFVKSCHGEEWIVHANCSVDDFQMNFVTEIGRRPKAVFREAKGSIWLTNGEPSNDKQEICIQDRLNSIIFARKPTFNVTFGRPTSRAPKWSSWAAILSIPKRFNDLLLPHSMWFIKKLLSAARSLIPKDSEWRVVTCLRIRDARWSNKLVICLTSSRIVARFKKHRTIRMLINGLSTQHLRLETGGK